MHLDNLKRGFMKTSKSQFAVEFIVLMAFMFLIFLGFIAVITSNVLKTKEKERLEIAENIAAMAKNEIDLAVSASNGYNRSFELPIRVAGSDYEIYILGNGDATGNKELVVKYADKEHVSFLPQVCGDIFVPNNEISKENNVICVNADLDEEQCTNAQSLGLCDQLDQTFLPGTKCCCQLRYNKCN